LQGSDSLLSFELEQNQKDSQEINYALDSGADVYWPHPATKT
jgi:hypothetical protein